MITVNIYLLTVISKYWKQKKNISIIKKKPYLWYILADLKLAVKIN